MTMLVPLYVGLIKNLLHDFENNLLSLVRAMGN